MNIYTDSRIVMTLDAGGTNFVFSAIQGGKEVVRPLTLPSNAHDLDICLKTIIQGFEKVKTQLEEDPVAISFAFPGPSDYKTGVIGNLGNLPCFSKGGVALGPMLEDYFKLPTFIANDGDLFTYGEAMAGVIPDLNRKLRERGVHKQYSNLLGITLGTGFGGGIVMNQQLCQGDNSAAGEIWLTRNFKNPNTYAEEGVSIRAVKREYLKQADEFTSDNELDPKDIYEIAIGKQKGDQRAALKSYKEMAVIIAESISNIITMLDGIIVIGGGMSGAYSLIIPEIISLMNGKIENMEGYGVPRLVSKTYDLEDPDSLDQFLTYKMKSIKVPYSNREMLYTSEKRIGVCCSKLGTSQAISLGAYALALEKLSDSKQAIVKSC